MPGTYQGAAGSPDARRCRRLVGAYTGRFALDFEYEEWAAPYRDWLHASYLEIVERAVTTISKLGTSNEASN